MIMEMRRLREKIRGVNCLIVGDVMLDKYLYGSVTRISPEAPIPVVNITGRKVMPGGAANVAANVRSLGANVILFGIIGDDEDGKTLNRIFDSTGIVYGGIRSSERITTVKTRIIGKGQQVVRFDEEKSEESDQKIEQELLFHIREEMRNSDIVIISDYNKGVCTESLLNDIISMAKRIGIPVVVDPKEKEWTKYIGADFITPNYKEFCEAVGRTVENTEEAIKSASAGLFEKFNLTNLLVTRSEHGMTLVERNKTRTFEAMARSVYDVSGAGDTVLAAMSVLLAAGLDSAEAVELSNIAAGISVSHSGTYCVTFDELESFFEELNDVTDSKRMNMDELYNKLSVWKKDGKKIVFTNGCFDILHAGHVTYLQKARNMGDVLVVGLNSDVSVKRLKGEGRPVNKENDRAILIAALAAVDAVVVFDQDTPLDLIKAVEPDVLVKGGDYRIEDIVGREYAKETVVIPLLEGRSTTGIIEKIENGRTENERAKQDQENNK